MMKFSVKMDYACRAVVALAMHQPDPRPMRIEEIARQEGMPASYLVQILIELKGKGLIQSRRGKAGGYVLARPAGEITMGDVIRAVHGEIVELPPLNGGHGPEEITRAWQRVKSAVESAVDGITIEQICSRANEQNRIYYI